MNKLLNVNSTVLEASQLLGEISASEMPEVLSSLNVASITFCTETICFGLRSSTPTITLPRRSIERSTIDEVREEIRDALSRVAKQAEPMNQWLSEDAAVDDIVTGE